MLDPQVVEPLLIASASVALLALLLSLVALVRLRRLRRSTDLLQAGTDGESFVDVVAGKVREVQAMRSEVAGLVGDIAVLREEVRDALRHVAVVRYDAFGDMGGRLSFSAAVLDDNGDGIVLSSIHGRSETRTYLKGVLSAGGENLSPEEQQAIAHAVKGARGRAS